MVNDEVFERVSGISHLYVKTGRDGRMTMIMEKVTDDLLLAGDTEALRDFIRIIKGRFEVRKDIVDDVVMFNGCDIRK